MELDFFATPAKLFNLKFRPFFRELHINFVPLCNVVLTLTDGTD